jgi:uncharacterized protein YndB with AHSA1/START domain
MSKLTLKSEGDRHVVVTRRFSALPEAVYRAHTEPRLIQRWMLGPDGWTMPVCVCDARPGGKFRYEWADGKGRGFYITGELRHWSHSAELCTWSACICRTQRQTTTSRRASTLTQAAR